MDQADARAGRRVRVAELIPGHPYGAALRSTIFNRRAPATGVLIAPLLGGRLWYVRYTGGTTAIHHLDELVLVVAVPGTYRDWRRTPEQRVVAERETAAEAARRLRRQQEEYEEQRRRLARERAEEEAEELRTEEERLELQAAMAAERAQIAQARLDALRAGRRRPVVPPPPPAPPPSRTPKDEEPPQRFLDI